MADIALDTNHIRHKLTRLEKHLRGVDSTIYRFAEFVGKELPSNWKLSAMGFHGCSSKALDLLAHSRDADRPLPQKLTDLSECQYEDLRDAIPEIFAAVAPEIADDIRTIHGRFVANRAERLDPLYEGASRYQAARSKKVFSIEQLTGTGILHSISFEVKEFPQSRQLPIYLGQSHIREGWLPRGTTHYLPMQPTPHCYWMVSPVKVKAETCAVRP